MFRATKPLIFLTATAVTLAACTAPDGTARPKTTNGALIGGLLGGLLAADRGGDAKGDNIVLGAIAGATIGGLIGQQLDAQEKALRDSIGNGQVGIVNTGKELIVTLPDAITFETGSAAVRESPQADLRALAGNLNQFPDTTVDIFGHTDNVGAAGFNQQLSAERAISVQNVLANAGVSAERMRAIGRGEDEPKTTNLTEEGRAQNRRVEIVIRPVT